MTDHTIDRAFITTIADRFLDSLNLRGDDENDRPLTGIHVTVDDLGRAHLEATRMAHTNCDYCGQPLPRGVPGPLDAVNPRTGEYSGTYSHQHGCGELSPPVAVSTVIDTEIDCGEDIDDEDDDSTLAVAEETITGVIDDLLARLDRDVAEEVKARTEYIEDHLRTQLRVALARLAEPLADGETTQARIAEVHTGEHNPGVYLEHGTWHAWDFDPAGDEPITISERDLTAPASHEDSA